MHIVLAGVSHETNTYCQGLTTVRNFHSLRGDAMLAAAGQETDVGGAVTACQRLGVEAVPLLFTQAQPSGTIARDTFEAFAEEILSGLRATPQIDAVVLLLHGAGVAEGIDDIEGELVQRIRKLIGPDVPITASFDLHGNVTQRMCDGLNGVFACHQYPHIDLHVQADAAVALAVRMVKEQRRSRCCLVNAPLLLPTTTTFVGIGEQMLAEVLAREESSAVVDISWFHGFPYTDIKHVGSSAVVTWFPDELEEAGARDVAHATMQRLWELRESFRPVSLSASEALEQALADARDAAGQPVVVHETSDNCGAGTPGDGTHLLRAMLDAGLGKRACFGFIVDPVTAAQAHTAGVGATIEVELGARTDELHGTPILAKAKVKALHDGRVTLQRMFRGMPLNLGPLARLVIDDMDVVVGSRRSQTFDREPFLAVGIDVLRYDIVALKSSSHFRAEFQSLAHSIVTADTPGLSTHDIAVFPRQATARALWPIDPRAEFAALDLA